MKRIKILLLHFLLLVLCFPSKSQCPVVGFNIPVEVCIDENLSIENTSTISVLNEWDFCAGDLSEIPIGSYLLTNSLLNSSFGISVIQDNDSWYGFIPSQKGEKLLRLDFKESLSNPPVIVDLGNINNLFNDPGDIEIIREDGNWFGLLINTTSNNLIRLNFGSSLGNLPTATNLSDFNIISASASISIHKDQGNIKVFIANGNISNIIRLDFGTSILNSPEVSSFPISGAISLRGLSIIKDCDHWYGIVSSYANDKIFKLDFGNNLNNIPVINEIASSGISFSNPTNSSLVLDNGKYFGFVQSRNGDLYKLSFGGSMGNSAIGTNLGKLGVLSGSSFGFTMAKEISDWYGFTIDFSSNNLYKIKFPNACAVNKSLSLDFNPLEIAYNAPGTYHISLTTHDINGNINTISKSISVIASEAPEIDFSFDESRCLDNVNTFTAISPDEASLTSYTWAFGDGTTATGSEVTHQYTAPGTYKVRLTVESEGGCGNFIEKEINIYPAPAPDFTFPTEILCTNGTIAFENTTPGEYNDDITWTWDFGDGTTSAEKNPSHTYETGGTKTVTLKASIPGCEAAISHDLEVIPGPSVDFSAANLCFGEEVQFTNLSTGSSITDYAWDFGNGETSTLENPTITYDAVGTYEVSLTVHNTSGCNNIFTKSITVHSLPEVDFDHALACSSSPTPFEDRSTVDNGSISSWLWDFGDGETSTEKNPAHIFVEPGTYEVKLIATSSWGCVDSTSQMVLVKAAPKADFIVERGCPGATSRFIDASIIPEGDNITNRVWVVNGTSIYSENPEILFSRPGTYTVSLTVTSSNACQSSITKTVVIDPLPTVDFSFSHGCVGEKTVFTDLSQAMGSDEITGWQWKFGEIATSSEQHPEIIFPQAGDVPVTLTVTTARGCSVSINKVVKISALPRAAFSVETNFGAPPLRVNFKNNTSGAVSYQWLFGDSANSMSTEENPSFIYTAIGQYEAKLIATNAAGCTDTASLLINTLIPDLNVGLEQLNTFTTSGDRQVVLTIVNKGSIAIKDMDILLDLGGRLKLKEQFIGNIEAGESHNYPLSFEIPEENIGEITYVCASLVINDTEYTEEDLTDNKLCKDIGGEFVLLPPYPNPVDGTFHINFILPEEAPVRLMLVDMLGKLAIDMELQNTQAGLNDYRFDLSPLTAGIYMVKIIHEHNTYLRKVMVR